MRLEMQTSRGRSRQCLWLHCSCWPAQWQRLQWWIWSRIETTCGCDVMWCDVMLCYVMLCVVMWCDVMWCDVMRCYVMSCYFMLCYVILCYVMCGDVMWFDVMWCEVRWCYVFDMMWCDVMFNLEEHSFTRIRGRGRLNKAQADDWNILAWEWRRSARVRSSDR